MDTTNHQPTIGLIGLGNIGLLHADRYAALGASLAGMDTTARARQRFANRYDSPVFDDHHNLFDTVDAVVVAVPNAYHDRYAVAALESGLDVFLEKPMADTVPNAVRIADSAATAEGVCMVGFHNRFRPIVEQFKQLQEVGRFGSLTHVQANYVRQRGVPDSGAGGWFTQRAIAGGGAVIDIGVHAIDLALYLTGYPLVDDIVGTTRRAPEHEFDVEDAASAFIRCVDGTTISLEVAWQSNGPDNRSFVIEGTEGGAMLHPNEERLELFESGHKTDIHVDPVDPYERQARSFLRAIERGTPPRRNTVTEALAVQQVIDGIYRSAADDTPCGELTTADEPAFVPGVSGEQVSE
ncbi:oxidoreductase [Natrialba chahannaoensis JCM 10990]|uniref:Oxidoreductase n=1 Tax=Natrialba chahannaoensis JCM 10990 TaxID=1227492 RepID=M0A5S6_9EURY|nr:Gfo/Idh/MocA family oxidoreductase [Natrialba chahannaoensis]ELY93262.1 oxidoreductase [Natrialba chahannaoensis JCM 10990]